MKLVLQDPAAWEVEAKTPLSGRSSQREDRKTLRQRFQRACKNVVRVRKENTGL